QDTVFGLQTAKLSVTKADNLNPAKYDHVGQIVGYTLTAKNTGTVTRSEERRVGKPSMDGFRCNPTLTEAELAPNATVVCTGTHTITQGDMDTGSFIDVAHATSTEANAPDAQDTVFAQQTAKLSVTKTDNLNPAKYDHVGQVVTYTLTAKNTGTVT